MRGMATSYPPERVNDAHAHSADSREQAAGGADQQREPKANGEQRFGKKKRGQQTSESYANNGDEQVGESQTNDAADEGDDDGLRQHEEKNSAPGETDGLKDSQFRGALADRDSHGVAGDQEKRKEDNAADDE